MSLSLTLTIPVEVKLYNHAKTSDIGKPKRNSFNNKVITESGRPSAGTARSAICISGQADTA